MEEVPMRDIHWALGNIAFLWLASQAMNRDTGRNRDHRLAA
jgi:hypothetical protein